LLWPSSEEAGGAEEANYIHSSFCCHQYVNYTARCSSSSTEDMHYLPTRELTFTHPMPRPAAAAASEQPRKQPLLLLLDNSWMCHVVLQQPPQPPEPGRGGGGRRRYHAQILAAAALFLALSLSHSLMLRQPLGLSRGGRNGLYSLYYLEEEEEGAKDAR
jgi:hypothetical protein